MRATQLGQLVDLRRLDTVCWYIAGMFDGDRINTVAMTVIGGAPRETVLCWWPCDQCNRNCIAFFSPAELLFLSRGALN